MCASSHPLSKLLKRALFGGPLTYGLLIKALCLFFLAPRIRRSRLLDTAIASRVVWGPTLVSEDHCGYVLTGDLHQRLEEPHLQRRRALQPTHYLTGTLGVLILPLALSLRSIARRIL
jgi:hypothetical protein